MGLRAEADLLSRVCLPAKPPVSQSGLLNDLLFGCWQRCDRRKRDGLRRQVLNGPGGSGRREDASRRLSIHSMACRGVTGGFDPDVKLSVGP